MERLKNKDCDIIGKNKYPHVYQTHKSTEVVTAQARLANAEVISPLDCDGVVGQRTLEAIEKWEEENGEDFYTGQPKEVVEIPEVPETEDTNMATMTTETEQDSVIVPEVPHVSQGHPDIADIEIVPQKPVRRIGCLSCCVEIIRSKKQGSPFALAEFVARMKEKGGYTAGGDLIWATACSEYGFTYLRDISPTEAKKYLAEDTPVILRVDKKTHFHFVIGVGFTPTGFLFHDVGTRFGNAYDDPERNFTPYSEVTRIDVLV